MAHSGAQVIISPVEPVLTTKQVGAILQIHQRSVERLIADGKLEAITIGRRWRVTATQLQAFIARQSKPRHNFLAASGE